MNLKYIDRKGASELMTTIAWIILAAAFILLAGLFLSGKFDELGCIISRALPIPGSEAKC